jgi:hypothetical protein
MADFDLLQDGRALGGDWKRADEEAERANRETEGADRATERARSQTPKPHRRPRQ